MKAAFKAQERALELCSPDNYADWVMTRLDRAQCLAYTGKTAEGLEYAAETISGLPPSQRKGIITLRGTAIIEGLPQQEKKLVPARDLSELLSLTTGKGKAES